MISNLKEWLLMGGALCLAWLAFRSKKIFYAKLFEREMQGKHLLGLSSMKILDQVFTGVIVLITLMVILHIWGLDIVPLLTLSGIGAAALGFASRDVGANFFGGVTIFIANPFRVGEYIELPGKKMAGNVEEVGWYFTSIRDLNKRVIYIPNSLFTTETLLNHSRITHRRIEEKIRIKTPERAQRIIEEIRNLLMHHPKIDPSQSIEVFLIFLSPYGMEIEIKAYIRNVEYVSFMQIKQEILLEVYKIAFQAGEVRT